jgi:hypothetical protein
MGPVKGKLKFPLTAAMRFPKILLNIIILTDNAVT